MWFGMGELNLIIFFWVPGATTTCTDIPIKMSLACKMLRSDTVHHKIAWQVPPLYLRAPFFQVIAPHRVLSSLFLSMVISYCVSSLFADLYMIRAPTKSGLVSAQKSAQIHQLPLGTCTYKFCSLFPGMKVSLTFAHSCFVKHPKPKNCKICHNESQKRKKMLFAYFLWKWSVHLRENICFWTMYSSLFPFLKLSSHTVFFWNCVFLSLTLITSYSSSFCCYCFILWDIWWYSWKERNFKN